MFFEVSAGLIVTKYNMLPSFHGSRLTSRENTASCCILFNKNILSPEGVKSLIISFQYFLVLNSMNETRKRSRGIQTLAIELKVFGVMFRFQPSLATSAQTQEVICCS